MKKYSLSALVAAGLLAGSAGMASAADLGGNCCADLEERIAELEATTVRKGNRKVSLTITGWVGEQVTWWDDGREHNIYVTGLGATLASNFKFTGTAKVTSDVTAGYLLHIEARTADPLLGGNQNTDEGGGTALALLQSYWFLKSNHYGQVSVGLQSTVTDNLAILTDGSGSLVQANWVLFEGRNFFLRFAGASATQINGGAGALTWGDGLNCYSVGAALNTATGGGIGGDCTGAPVNSVMYVSPTIAGFSVSTAWGEDDFWDVGVKYAGEWSGFKIAAAIGYSQSTDTNAALGVAAAADFTHAKYDQLQLGGYIQHLATGLFIHGAYLKESIRGVTGAHAAQGLNDLNPEHWYVKGGIRQKWLPFGNTVVYGEYSQGHDQITSGAATTAWEAGVRSSDIHWWGVGVVQEIDAAAMSMWIKYRNVDGSLTLNAPNATTGLALGKNNLDNLQMITFGAMISF